MSGHILCHIGAHFVDSVEIVSTDPQEPYCRSCAEKQGLPTGGALDSCERCGEPLGTLFAQDEKKQEVVCMDCAPSLLVGDEPEEIERDELVKALNQFTDEMEARYMSPYAKGQRALGQWAHNGIHAIQERAGVAKCALCGHLTGNRFRPMSHQGSR